MIFNQIPKIATGLGTIVVGTFNFVRNHPVISAGGTVVGTGAVREVSKQVLSPEAQETLNSAVKNATGTLLDVTVNVTKSGYDIIKPGLSHGFRFAIDFFKEELKEDVLPFAKQVTGEVTSVTIQTGKELIETAATTAYREIKEAIPDVCKEPPTNAIGPVELLVEKVQQVLPNIMEALVENQQTIAATAAVIGFTAVAYTAYRNRQAIANVWNRLTLSTIQQ